MHGSRSKIPSKKISSGSVAGFNSGVKGLNIYIPRRKEFLYRVWLVCPGKSNM
jgi:hypothetical protein